MRSGVWPHSASPSCHSLAFVRHLFGSDAAPLSLGRVYPVAEVRGPELGKREQQIRQSPLGSMTIEGIRSMAGFFIKRMHRLSFPSLSCDADGNAASGPGHHTKHVRPRLSSLEVRIPSREKV